VFAVCVIPYRAMVSCLVKGVISVDGSIRPRKRDGGDTMLSLEAVGLVKMSARLSLLEMNRKAKVLEETLSRMK
jgi:hypothetical protein